MKKIFGIALAALALSVSSSAFAQTPGESPAGKKCQKEVCQKENGCDKQKSCPAMKAFEGLNLTDAQKEAIKKLDQNCQKQAFCKDQKQAVKKEAKKDLNKKELKAGKDSLQLARRQAMDTRRADFLKQVKEILTPEQYTTFLENSFIQSGSNKAGFGPQQMKKQGMQKQGMQKRQDRKGEARR